MFVKFIVRALKFRRQRLLLAFAALTVAATLATVLFGIYGSVESRIGNEFRAYGANIVAMPAEGDTVPLALAAAAERAGATAAPFLVTSGLVGKQTVAVAGFMPGRTRPMTDYWHVSGRRNVEAGECLAGETLARALHAEIGGQVALAPAPCTLRGIVSTGGAEDRELLIPFENAAALAGVHDRASLIEIRTDGGRVEQVRASLARSFPGTDVRTIRSVAGTEANVVVKIRSVVFLLTAIILAITTLCVSSNFNEMVIERSSEIGILKALGARDRRIAAFFIAEAAALAVCAALVGYPAGSLAAAGIGRQIFGRGFHADASPWIFPVVAVVMLSVAAIATAIATSSIRGMQPAVILRGD